MNTVSMTIDYSNGAQKHFARVPYKKGLTILGALEMCAQVPPGAKITSGSDRAGHVLGLGIDGIPPKDGPASEWVVWVNAKHFQGRLGTETSFGFKPSEREGNLLEAGDHVLFKLSLAPEE